MKLKNLQCTVKILAQNKISYNLNFLFFLLVYFYADTIKSTLYLLKCFTPSQNFLKNKRTDAVCVHAKFKIILRIIFGKTLLTNHQKIILSIRLYELTIGIKKKWFKLFKSCSLLPKSKT